VMAYFPGTAIPYFSNPDLTYAGVPLGKASSANAARIVRENAAGVAAYRTGTPVGAIESATITTITGYAFDPRTSDPLNLRIDIHDQTRTTLLADESRDSLTQTYGITVHGFSYTLPVLTQGKHTVKIYAVDPFTGASILIATRKIDAPNPLFD